jgi:predicted AAA+ superfamily ATPase
LKLRTSRDLAELLTLGGFPEPFFSGSEVEARRWSRQYRTLLVREEVSDLESVHDLGTLELLALRLPELVGSPLSINALREDLEVSHRTLGKWLDILERLYSLFRVTPFGAPKLRAVKKARKHYHFDWTLVREPGPRFENLVAAHLLKWVHFQQDELGLDLDLRFFRDVDGREVDFVVMDGRAPVLLVECKWADDSVSPALRYLKSRFPAAEAWQISATGKRDYQSAEGIRVAPAIGLLKTWV